MDKKTENIAHIGVGLIVLGILTVGLSFGGFLVWAAVHFLLKVW